MTFIFFTAGLLILIAGSELLVRGASSISARVGLSPLIIGLTVVAFGTSAPEMAVSVKASLDGQAGLTIGNVVGSNIFNVLFILGISAIIVPLAVQKQLIRIDVPIMIGGSFLIIWLSSDMIISPAEGAFLFLGIIIYTVVQIRIGLKTSSEEPEEKQNRPSLSLRGIILDLLLIMTGLALLVFGARWLVDSAVIFAKSLGVSELVIGLTIVAAGTSLPEVATSIMAAFKGQKDMAIGNVVGSNIFNLFAVLGLSAIVGRNGIPVSPEALQFDLPVMAIVAMACLPILFTGFIITRTEGSILFASYVIYTILLILMAREVLTQALVNIILYIGVLPNFVGYLIMTLLFKGKRKPK